MKLNPWARQLRQENRDALKEIFYVAHNSDVDRGTVREYVRIRTLYDSEPRRVLPYVGAVAVGLVTAGFMIHYYFRAVPKSTLDHTMAVITSATLTLMGLYGLRQASCNSTIRLYEKAKKEALEKRV